VAGNLALVPLLGVEGAAIATALAFTIAAVLNRRALTRVTGIDPAAMLLGERSSVRPRAAAPSGIEYRVIADANEIAALGAEWKALEHRTGSTLQAFNTQAWNRRWLAAYITRPGAEPRPVVVTAREQGRLVLVWPLLVQRRFGLRLATFFGAPVSQYGDVLVEHRQDSRQIIAAALDVIVSRLKPDALWLRKVRDDAALTPVLAPSGAHRSETHAAPFVALADTSGAVRYESLYSAKSLKNRRRLLRRLEESGTVVFEDLRGGDRARDLVDLAFAMKRAWLAERGLVSAAIDDDRALAFFRDAAAAPPQDGGAWVSTLRLDGRPIAINLMLEAGNRIYAHIITYDLAYARSGVGVLLLEHCIRTAITEGRTVFDLLAPADPYKSDWADASVGVHDWCLPLTGRGRLYEIVYLGGARRLAKRLLDAIPCGVRQRLRALHQRLRGRAPGQTPAPPTNTA
jgi:CelD/BcsL family acetyltransferase involved in cellulose biosynthesis